MYIELNVSLVRNLLIRGMHTTCTHLQAFFKYPSLFIPWHCQPEIWMLFHGLLRSWKIQKVVVFEYKLWKVMQNDWIWNVLEKWQGKNSIIRSVLLNYFGPIFMVISQESTRNVLKKFMSTLEILWLQKHAYLMFSAFSWLQFIPALQVDNIE